MGLKSIFTPKILAEELGKLFWSALPALLIGYGFHNIKMGLGILFIMFFVTSMGANVDRIYETIIKK